MRSRFILAVAIASSVATVAGAQPVSTAGPSGSTTTISFNGLSENQVVTNQFAGVTFSNGICASSAFAAYFGNDAMQALNFSAQDGSCNGANVGTSFTVNFAQTINTFGFKAVTDGGNINFTTANGSAAVADPFDGQGEWAGIYDAAGFNSVTVTVDDSGLDPDGPDTLLAFDDVTYGSDAQAAPEPASLVLLGTGLVGVAGIARRRRASK